MTDKEILDKLKEPGDIIDPKELNEVIIALNEWVTAGEKDLMELNLTANLKWSEIRKGVSNRQADMAWKVTPEYQAAETKKLQVRELKRHRDTLKDRLYIITSMKNRYR